MNEAREVLEALDKEGKLGTKNEDIIIIMAPYYASKRIAKLTGNKSGLDVAFNEQTRALREVVPERLLKEIFSL